MQEQHVIIQVRDNLRLNRIKNCLKNHLGLGLLIQITVTLMKIFTLVNPCPHEAFQA